MGRTGQDVRDRALRRRAGDIVNIAKGIASGLPLGVTCARADVMSWPPGAHASTFGGNPVSCAAALATIALLHEQFVANAAAVGAHLMAGLRALQDKHPLIGDVRGRGLMIGVELVRDRQTKVRAVERAQRRRPDDVQEGRPDPWCRPELCALRPTAPAHQRAGRCRSARVRRIADRGVADPRDGRIGSQRHRVVTRCPIPDELSGNGAVDSVELFVGAFDQ